MELSAFFKSVIDMDTSAVVICDLSHTIVYMNPAAAERYSKRGGYELVGKSLLNCHGKSGNERILQVVDWFGKCPENNRVYTFYNEKENKDVYMIALRDGDGALIGYYEKHEYRNRETAGFYEM
ncbi:MAG: PAS domain-containing protein [Prevotella sp.]|nr:PAS domain-containing protein [Prevotella sp.]